MNLKLDKNGNVEGFVKKEHHEKTVNNLLNKLEEKDEELETIRESYMNLTNNHEIFLSEYKKKCEECNKLELKLENKNVSKDLINELEDYKRKCNAYFQKYGSLTSDKD